MKNLFTLLFLFSALLAHTQVKIGDNPNSINSNSLLELESSNKGFLPPRVALNSITSVAPLTGTVTAGMLVYSTGGTLANGFYFWNSAKWVLFNSSTRDNYVLVKSAADLPAPVGGVITLVAGTSYEINGTIILTSKINLNNCTIVGMDRAKDVLIYTPTTGELFTGANGGLLQNITLQATGVGAKLFNLDGGNSVLTTLLLENVYIFNCNDIGLIKGFGGTIAFQSVAYSNNTNGFTFQDIGRYISINEFWIQDNQNTYAKFVGVFSHIQILGGERHGLSFFSAKAIDISGITAITYGSIKSAFFAGDGVRVVGTFSNAWEVESIGIDTEKDDVSTGNIYISSSATTNFSAVNTPVKVLGTTTALDLFRVTSNVNNRLSYTGTKTKRFQVIASLSVTAQAANKDFSFYISKNGVVLPESKQGMRLSSGVDKGSATLSCTIQMSTNDYLEVWAANDSDITSLLVETLNMAIK